MYRTNYLTPVSIIHHSLLISLCVFSDKAQLQRYLIEGYQEKLDVTLLPGWEQLHVSDIFTPMIFLGEQKQGSDKEMVYKKLDSYEEIFFKDNVLQTRVFVLGKAGAGKTTFIKHLTDVWCKRNITPQFANVEVVQKFQFFFYVSCRFAEKDKTLLHMIKYQLFKDEDEATWDVAVYVLKHNPECCFIALDGADEWEGPPTSYTGRSGDIVGLPGMAGVDGCVLLITSRPCRFYALSTKTQKIFRRLKLKGIKNVEEFAECILKKLEDPNPGQSCYNFFSQIEENNMSELMETPLMLINALGVWENDQSLHKSMCINYINMIQLFIRRAKGEEGWPISESRFLRLIPNLVNLETKWEQQLDQLPNLFLRYETLHTYAGLFLSLGHIASDLLLGEDQSLVFSKQVCKSYLLGESLNVCLALGIIAKTETTTRGIKKVERYLFCHKTFQEFFAALWLASKYATEGTILLCEHVKTVYDVYDYSILIQFLCAFCPDAGKQFWLNVAEEVMEKDEQVQRYRADGLPAGSRHFYLQDLVCRCMREARIDEKSDQCYFCCPDIWINDDTSDEDITLLCKMTYLYSNIKSMYVSYNSERPKQHVILSKVRPISYACGLQTLVLRGVCRSVLDLQKHNKLTCLKLWDLSVDSLILPSTEQPGGLLLPVEGTTISEVIIIGVTLTHHDMEQLTGWLSSCSSLEKLQLWKLSCSDHGSGCILPVLLELQKCNKLKKLELRGLSVEGLLLPVQGTRISEVIIIKVTLTHHDMEQLIRWLSSCSSLGKLHFFELSCSDHSSECILPALLDLQKCNKLESLELWSLPVEGLLLPVEGTTISEVIIIGVTLAHHDMEQMIGWLSSCSSLEKLALGCMSCSDHRSGCILPVLLDLQKCNKLKKMELWSLPVDGLLLPVEGTTISEVIIIGVTLIHHKMEQLTGCLSSCSSLEKLELGDLSCSDQSSGCIFPVLLDLQKCNKLVRLDLRNLSVEGLLLPVEGTTISEVIIIGVTLTHHKMEQLTGCLSSCSSLEKLTGCLSSCSSLEKLKLGDLSCSDQSSGCILPVLLDLQKCNNLGRLELRNLSVEGLLLPVEGTRISEVIIIEVTLTHHDMEQLTGSLSSCSSLEKLVLGKLSCRDQSRGCILPALLDLQNCNKLGRLELRNLSVEGLLLPVDGTRISEVIITEVILTHHGMEQLTGSLSSCSSLETLVLKLSCRDHSSGCILPVLLDLQKCNKLKKLGLRGLSVEGLLTPSHIQGHINWALLLSDVKMSAQSWRKFIETIAQYSAVPSVKLSYCNIDRDTRDFISSCSQFSVRRNDETCVQFYKVKRLL